VNLSLRLTEHRAMKTYGGSGTIAPLILNLALVGGEWSASRPRPPNSWGKSSQYPFEVGPRASLEVMAKRKISLPYRKSNSGHAARSQVAMNVPEQIN